MHRGRVVTALSLVGAGAIASLVGRSIVRKRRAERQTIASKVMSPEAVAELHAAKVQRIAAQLRAHDGSKPVSLRKKAPPHQVPKGGDLRRRDSKIDVSDLTTILSVDPISRTAVAESGVMFCDLVEATLRHG